MRTIKNKSGQKLHLIHEDPPIVWDIKEKEQPQFYFSVPCEPFVPTVCPNLKKKKKP